mmetsp:Transcript_6203/g.9113  ORF Transcript_6203/g.9113 Transcript_6203/m.9113 type:complete len:468 (+) Transcript_6203:251-1654(+)|eukprot:CAMPEP_0194203250 /NCGR_PEP_ID=MMETSP0156-20130528/3069_1 /TAXON_ID=33649 /ORGANISM="Thalassionema nitzschioides, Strain L26-B" /LENGTH=467 /DNA_ID=CAMNT_0038928959 /DNA_START=237 /DNA_END=1640 /DNA_ORIENTATION=+
MHSLILFFAATAELGNLCLANSIPSIMTPTKHRKTQKSFLNFGYSDEQYEPEKQRPCVKPDGDVWLPPGYSVNDFNDRRSLWESCKENSDDSDEKESSIGFLTTSSAPSIIEPESSESSSSDDTDDKLPFIEVTPDVLEKLQPFKLELSIALPKPDRRYLRKFEIAAQKFQPKLVKALTEIIEDRTEFQVRAMMPGGSGEGDYPAVSARVYGEDEIKKQKLILIHPRQSNVTEVGEDDNVCWWKYSIALVVLPDYYDEAVSEIQNAFVDSIEDGKLLEHLKMKYRRLVDVCLPGDEVFMINPKDDDSAFEQDFWAVYQWIGLGLFSVTIIATIAMTKTAQKRRKVAEKQDNWGIALATENDINHLLTYGWEFQGNQVRAFDKTRMIYRDDDSILIGGMQLGNAIQPDDQEGTPTEAVTTETPECPTERSPSSNMDSSVPGSSGVLTSSTEATGTRDVDQPPPSTQSD